MTVYSTTPSDLLGSEGPLAASIPGFTSRPPQQEMSEAVLHALQNRTVLVTEAGTGIGKTFAYLIPALLDNGKVIISTGTRHLQDQLYHRDLPVVIRSLGFGADTALLKGRSNYLCLQRLEDAERGLFKPEQQLQLQAIKSWANLTRSGDIVELTDIPEDSTWWPKITSTAENCLGTECPRFNRCHVVKARRRAQEADIVVVNHHLFFADMALKEDGFGEILPSAHAFILDEAHQLPETATRFFGQSVSMRQLQELAQDTMAAQLREAADMPVIREKADALVLAGSRFRLQLGEGEQRKAWHDLLSKSVKQHFQQLCTTVHQLGDALESAAERGEALQNCHDRCLQLLQLLERFSEQSDHEIQWLETYRTGFVIHATPLNIAETFQRHMQAYNAAWIFTSATLSVNGRFEHFLQQMGLDGATTQQLDSPYDYARNAILYLPAKMPDPAEPTYTEALVSAAVPVLRASRGRAFILFTSHRALQRAATLLADVLDFPLFIQGAAPRSQLLDKFRVSGNGILLGTSSFWEGVDIKGEALSCVIIDKLPFAAPDDPVLQARLNMLRVQGENPFMEYQLPQAVIALKQGIGRLIRDANDRGVLMICDPRLKTKPYGRIFLASLPKMPVTRDIADVEAFLQSIAEPINA